MAALIVLAVSIWAPVPSLSKEMRTREIAAATDRVSFGGRLPVIDLAGYVLDAGPVGGLWLLLTALAASVPRVDPADPDLYNEAMLEPSKAYRVPRTLLIRRRKAMR